MPAPQGPGRAGRTGLVTSPRYLAHDTGRGHPERVARLSAILERLEGSGLAAELDPLEAPLAELAALERVHDARYLARARAVIEGGAPILDAGDTAVCPASWTAALAGSGGLLAACDRVMDGTWSTAFVAARPPGHHAERAEAMGFCIVNHVAVAARHLRERHGLARVAIVDWDVHHGNGTQHLFESDGTVFYASLHQYPHYPGTGAASERGIGDGEGATLNCPLAAGTGDREWLGALEERVLPALDAFRPDFVLVSAGFDAHRDDPLSGTLVSEEAYARMTALVLELAHRHAGGRLVALLEGGYDLGGLARSTEACIATLRTEG